MSTTVSMPTISVVLPTYNRSEILPRAIESVLQQTINDFELIVVDDASTDDTERVVARYDDCRISLLSHDDNRGGSAARNTGVNIATGDYIAFLDSDDEWVPNKLEAQLNELRSRSSDWIATYCDYTVSDHRQTNRIQRCLSELLFTNDGFGPPREGGEELIPYILMMSFALGGASNLFVRVDAVREVRGFDEDFQRHQDYEFLIRLLKRGQLSYLDEELTIKHEYDSPTAEKVALGKKKFFEKFRDDIDQAEQNGYDVYEAHMRQLMRLYCGEAKFSRTYEYYKKCDGLEPRVYAQLCWASAMGIARKIAS
jgi:glycosyltransferase involved in cell wall biosynthesis